MKYLLNKNIFIRKEENFKKNSTIIFSGDTGEMFRVNEEIYDILELCKEKISLEIIVNSLSEKYSLENIGSLVMKIENTIEALIEMGVLITYDE